MHKKSFHIRIVSLVFMAIIFAKTAHAEGIEIDQFTLDNGLKVIVIPNHRIPAVSHMLWFPSGGADDPSGKSGLAHFHEHVMFKGTPNFPAGTFEATVSSLGGDHNAFTTYDTTGYYVNIPTHALPRIMELEADRIRGIVPSDEDIIKERQVIIEERRARVENNPSALFSEQLNAILFVHHPYGTPLIGWQHEMEALDKQDVLTFHDQKYAANNATLILAGDITKAQAQPMVERYYGGLDARDIPPRTWNKEPPIRATKRLDMEHEQVQEPQWQRQYIAPSFGYGNHSDGVPLMVFSEWLGGGPTSFLYQELVVKQKVASSVYTRYSPFGIGPERFTIGAIPAKNVSLEKLEDAIDGAIDGALDNSPNAQDIARAKTLLKAQTLYAREGLQGVAYITGFLTMMGMPTDYINQWPKDVDAATVPAMVEAARRVLLSEGHVTGTLRPALTEEK